MICPYCKKEIEPVEQESSVVSVIKDKLGRVQTWTEEIRDYNGILVSKQIDEYAYALSGEIDTINQKQYDGKGMLLSSKIIKHYLNGRILVIDQMEIEAQGI